MYQLLTILLSKAHDTIYWPCLSELFHVYLCLRSVWNDGHLFSNLTSTFYRMQFQERYSDHAKPAACCIVFYDGLYFVARMRDME